MTEAHIAETKSTVFNFLLDNGCCKRCAVRYVDTGYSTYGDLEKDVKSITSDNVESSEQAIKKSKLNPCVICLDLLHESTIDSMMASPDLDKVSEYDCDTFVNFISYPTAIFIREHGMEIYVKEKFPSFFKAHQITPINRAWSLSIQNKLGARLKKSFNKNSNLQVQFSTTYELDKTESNKFNVKGHNNGQTGSPSRNVVVESLKKIQPEEFKQRMSVPPEVPTKSVHFEQVSFKHEFIYIAGRYCKLSRNLFQTPWITDEAEVINFSVQEIIFEALNDLFNCNSMVFSTSGREDFDVRMLGRGRPFFVKIIDPKVTKIAASKFRSIEAAVRKSEVVTIRDLQFIDKKFVNNIKDGEQFKQKTYRALCIVEKPENVTSYIDKINSTALISLQQRTPLRVYHRRCTDVREREIYNMKARPVNDRDNLFELDLVTQAGTYVKEFVHGDMGRTSPSLCELIGGLVDIIALDVLDIHLDFPPPVE